MKSLLLLAGCFAFLGTQAQKRGVYTDLATAYQHPDKVRVLDLRGKELRSLSDSINRFQNIEVFLLGMKLRNLWLYRPALKYKLHLRRLPVGGYLHIQGRGGGEFYSFNRFETVPIDFCRFPKLQVLDIGGGLSFALADTVAVRMAKCRPQVIVLGGRIPSKDPSADFMASLSRWDAAKNYLHQFKIKQY